MGMSINAVPTSVCGCPTNDSHLGMVGGYPHLWIHPYMDVTAWVSIFVSLHCFDDMWPPGANVHGIHVIMST